MGRRVAIAGTIAVLIVFAALAYLVKRGLPFGGSAAPGPAATAPNSRRSR